MKKNLCAILSTILLNTVLVFTAQAQGLIINEISNGGTGAKEFVELLVVGNNQQKVGNVDLSHWIVDDNGVNALSDHITGIGISNGHLRLSADCFSSIPIGAIILIYNADDLHVNLPAIDIDDANNDGIYIIPHNSSCFEYCASAPTVTSTGGNMHYGLPNCNGSGYISNKTWGFIGLGNASDGMQTRTPNGELYHAFGYGLEDYAASHLHMDLGAGQAINNFIGAAQYAFQYQCGNPSLATSYQRLNFNAATPGHMNGATNANMIENIRNGYFNYNDWSDMLNCELILPLKLIAFEAKSKDFLYNELSWTLATVDPISKVYIQSSKDGIYFQTIAMLDLVAMAENNIYTYQDYTPFYTTYYRLKFEEPNAPISYSNVQVVMHMPKNLDNTIQIYPNPAQQHLNIFWEREYGNDFNYKVIDNLGRVVLEGILSGDKLQNTIAIEQLSNGIYFLQIPMQNAPNITTKFIKY